MTGGQFSIHWMPVVAIAGSLVTGLLIYFLAWKRGVSPTRIVLIGLGVSAAMSALIVYFIITGPTYLTAQAMSWLTGSVHGASWLSVWTLTPWIIVVIPLVLYASRHMDVLQFGEQIAGGLGSRVQRSRLLLLAASVLLAGAAVSIAGG